MARAARLWRALRSASRGTPTATRQDNDEAPAPVPTHARTVSTHAASAQSVVMAIRQRRYKSGLGCRYHAYSDAAWLALLGRRDRSLLAARCGVSDG